MKLPISSAYDYLDKRFGTGVMKTSEYVFVAKHCFGWGYHLHGQFSRKCRYRLEHLFYYRDHRGHHYLYTSAGGLQSVIWTDFIQTALFTGCALIIPIYILYVTGIGPLGWWESFSQAGKTEIVTFSLDPTVRVTTVGNMASVFFYFVCVSASDQMIVQRYLSTPSLTYARRSVGHILQT